MSLDAKTEAIKLIMTRTKHLTWCEAA